MNKYCLEEVKCANVCVSLCRCFSVHHPLVAGGNRGRGVEKQGIFKDSTTRVSIKLYKDIR